MAHHRRRRRRLRRRSPRRVAGLLLCIAVPLLTSSLGGPSAFIDKLIKIKGDGVLFRYQDYELRLSEAFPYLTLQRVPLRPISLSFVTSQEGTLDDFRGYPSLTKNSGTLSVDVARPVQSKLSVSYEDPPDAAPQVGTVLYQQRVPGIGDLSSKVNSMGEWALGLKRRLWGLGELSGVVDSEFDWSVALDKTYPALGGVRPSVSYGATQDGMRMNVTLDTSPDKNAHARYSVRNLPGQYQPADLIHTGKLALAAAERAHVLEAEGTYDHRFSKMPVRGSLSYTARTRPGQLRASVDFDRYRLSAQSLGAEVAASIARTPTQDGVRPKELEFKTPKLTAAASFARGKPRLRVNTAI
mmetsp:Transcript_137108/g.238304  ORF Transcript_137108/g.238304 Transcript_137108/m.238304 type:complete len:355 (-) Transcript_137108:91-1155(-)